MIFAAAFFMGCNSHHFINEDPVDSGTTPTRTDDGGGDDGITDGTDGTGDDGGTGDDSGTDDSGTAPPPGPCSNAYDPIHLEGWTKSYNATYSGDAGTATMVALAVPSAGTETDASYDYTDAMSTSGDGWTGTVHVKCHDGTDGAGMFVEGWEMSATWNGIAMTVTATDSTPRLYLPAESAMNTLGSWSYSYTLTAVTDIFGTIDNTVSGTYTELGTQYVALLDGTTVEAYALSNSYSMSSAYGTSEGVIDQWWVKGLGLVREIDTDSATSSSILTKDLTGYTGLSIEE